MTRSLILGASKGIGKVIAENRLKRRDAVVGVSRTKSDLCDTNYSHHLLDVADEAMLSKFLIEQKLLSFDNYIYCVGYNNIKTLEEIESQSVKDMFATNLFPIFSILKYLSKYNGKKYKSVVMISSIWASFGLPGRSIYGATKGAINGLTKHASSELSKKNIMVNCISPGFTRTELTMKSINDPLIEKSLKRTYSGELQDSYQIARCCDLLLSPHNKSITGQEIVVDSGFSSHA